ncbi:regulator of DNA class I crossover intermediates 1 [Candoia aspera]|uniref:regulator of DNA class I crossover intermediates 1 n=1 Tax=Candoia aspera TaxID=51853 RepID=UPI002FD8195F
MIPPSRRIMLTKERRKQKDFFEKEKLKSKMKLLGVSPFKSSAVSLDLLNLYVVNQISTKKENTDNIRKPIHVDINREIQIPLRKQNVEFPKSPECRPTKLFLDNIQHRIQKEILDNRRKYLFEKASAHSEDLGSSLPVNSKDEDLWLSTAAHRPEEFRAPDSDAPVGLYFQQLNSPGSDDFVDKDSGNSQANREEPLFGTVNDMAKTSPNADFQPAATLFEEENPEFLAFPPSQSYCSFSNKSHTDQLFADCGDAEEILSKHSLYGSEEMHQVTSPFQRCATERDLTSILTAPEMICSTNNQSLNAIKQKSIWNQFKDYSTQKRSPAEFSDQQQLTMFFENTGKCLQCKKTTEGLPVEHFPNVLSVIVEVDSTALSRCNSGLFFLTVFCSRKEGQADPNMNFLKIFEHEALDKEVSSDFDQHSEQRRQNDDDSQLSSQSPIYSPKQADSYTSSSSDEGLYVSLTVMVIHWMLTNEYTDSDLFQQSKIEEWNEEASYEGSFSRTSNHPCSGSENQRSERVCQFDSGPWNTANIQPQEAKSAGTPRMNMLNTAGLQLSDMDCKGKHDVSSQTDTCAEPVEKSNAAVQCDIIQVCNCKNELSFAHSAEIVTSASKVETTGGQNIPSDSTVLQPTNSNSLFTKNLSPETDCFIVSGKVSLAQCNK